MKNALLLLIILFGMLKELAAQKYNQIRWQNKPRNYIVYLPKNFDSNEHLPLIFNLHGFLNTSEFQMNYSKLNPFVDSVRSIVIYPEGVDLRWNSGTFFFISSDVDDVGFLSDLIDRAAVLYNADMKKIYAMGFSAGGFMSYKLACDLTNRITAIAPDVASMVYDNINSCLPTRPVNIAAFNGAADPITTYNGIPFNFPSIDSVKHFWQIKNNCNELPIIDTLADIKNDGTRVVKYSYQNCADNASQIFYKILNGGHVWPGADNVFFDVLGKTTQDISMNNVAWDFFKTKEIPSYVICDAPMNLQTNIITADSIVLSWSSVAGVPKYKIAIVDDSDKVVFYETTYTSIGIRINNPYKQYKWNVASLCASGYHNWTNTRNLNAIPTSIKLNTIKAINVFPNPTKDYIYLDLPKYHTLNSKLYIYNILGERVMETNLIYNNKIDVTYLSSGIYQLYISTEEDIYRSTFVIE